ncbi:MAG: beta-propeller fold lactonase family protein [Bdellovibrio sp.]|nr:beta-propeller fold lactonase family protein [Bdellovibrio sp.]
MKSLIVLSSLALALIGCSKGSGGGGYSPSPGPTPTPVAAAQFAYVLNTGDNSISSFAIGADGNLISFAVDVATGDFPKSMVMDKVRDVLYVGNLGSGSISQYKINSDGSLTGLGEIATGGMAENLVISPDHRFVYSMPGADDTINQFAIGDDGVLTHVADVPAVAGATGMAFSSDGVFAYIISLDITEISQFAMNGDGSLTSLSPRTVASSGCPEGPVATRKAANGTDNVYVLSCSTDEVEVFKVNPGGQLSSQQVVKTGILPVAMSFAGSSLYVVNIGDSNVSMFSVLNDGKLAALPQPTVRAGVQPESLAVDSVGNVAYVLDFVDDKILPYSVNPSRELVPASLTPTSSKVMPSRILLK